MRICKRALERRVAQLKSQYTIEQLQVIIHETKDELEIIAIKQSIELIKLEMN